MSITIILFILLAVLLIGALLWAARPIERRAISADAVLRALSEEHHYSRLSKILQVLQPEDTAFLGHGDSLPCAIRFAPNANALLCSIWMNCNGNTRCYWKRQGW